ncbi:MAG: hypothetical protein KAJ03_05725 [Gammaproteobacteria bacterium]|nr:hypothetical protein [Gammaproteobacteria bacterium]
MLMYMRLHIKHLDPKIHGLIAEHKADKGFATQEETITSLVNIAMVEFPKKIKDIRALSQKCIECGEKQYAEQLCEKCYTKKYYDGNPHNRSIEELRQ